MSVKFDIDSFTSPSRKITHVQLHCSASSRPEDDNVDVIRQWHTNPQSAGGRGWSDIGYHFYITFDGSIWVGRPIERIPAGIKGHNVGAIAICCSGLKKSDFTEAQMKSVKALCSKIDSVCEEPKITFHGHCEFANKLCPVYDYKRVLDLDEKGHLGQGATLPAKDYDHYPLTQPGDTGDEVFILQKLLGMENCDGVYGGDTKQAVKDYQEDVGIHVDGVAGPHTWAELI